MERTPLKRTPMKRTAKNQYDKEFDSMKTAVRERSGGYCEAYALARKHAMSGTTSFAQLLIDNPCTHQAAHVHHRKYRSRGGTKSLDNLLDVCLGCHGWIHSNETLSNALFLSLRSYQDESEK